VSAALLRPSTLTPQAKKRRSWPTVQGSIVESNDALGSREVRTDDFQDGNESIALVPKAPTAPFEYRAGQRGGRALVEELHE